MSPKPPPYGKTQDWVNPRVLRTKDRVLTVAREILLEDGPFALTYTTLARRSGVTRATLYKHWPSRQALLAAVVLTGPDVSYPSPGPDAREMISAFLLSLRDGLSDPPTAASLLTVAAQALHDPASANALATILDDRRGALNTLLADTGFQVTAEDYVLLTGPVIAHLLLRRKRVSQRFVHRIVDAWLAAISETRDGR